MPSIGHPNHSEVDPPGRQQNSRFHLQISGYGWLEHRQWDFQLHPKSFWGVDRFASSTNNKLQRFDARFHCPKAETINTFTAQWGDDFNWLCPPIALIGTTLKHARLCRAKCVLFVPEWKSAYFWPLITPDGKHFYSFVLDYLLLDPYFVNNSETPSVFDGFAKFRSLALLISF